MDFRDWVTQRCSERVSAVSALRSLSEMGQSMPFQVLEYESEFLLALGTQMLEKKSPMGRRHQNIKKEKTPKGSRCSRRVLILSVSVRTDK